MVHILQDKILFHKYLHKYVSLWDLFLSVTPWTVCKNTKLIMNNDEVFIKCIYCYDNKHQFPQKNID